MVVINFTLFKDWKPNQIRSWSLRSIWVYSRVITFWSTDCVTCHNTWQWSHDQTLILTSVPSVCDLGSMDPSYQDSLLLIRTFILNVDEALLCLCLRLRAGVAWQFPADHTGILFWTVSVLLTCEIHKVKHTYVCIITEPLAETARVSL